MYAYVDNEGYVGEVFASPKEFYEKIYHPDFVRKIIEIPSYVESGWRFWDNEWHEPEINNQVNGNINPSIVPIALYSAIVNINDNTDKARDIASMMSGISVESRQWEVGMITQPGDVVVNYDYSYIYSGYEKMTHNNPNYYPGANGVYYWSIIPKMHNGYKVYPDMPGISVSVRKGEMWWNSSATELYEWTREDNSNCVWYPGQSGVHEWQFISEGSVNNG